MEEVSEGGRARRGREMREPCRRGREQRREGDRQGLRERAREGWRRGGREEGRAIIAESARYSTVSLISICIR